MAEKVNFQNDMKIKELNISIKYKPIKNALGYFDEKTGEIVIHSEQTDIEKDIILIHEVLHLVASTLKQTGVIKKQPDHDFITNCSTQLLACFVLMDKWKNIKKEDILKYFE